MFIFFSEEFKDAPHDEEVFGRVKVKIIGRYKES